MINYIEKGYGLHKALVNAGLEIHKTNGIFSSLANHEEINTFIANYNPLPETQAEATEMVNMAAGEARTRYVTAVPSQDATYQMKLEDAKAFKLASYPEADLSSYPFIDGEAKALASTGQAAADFIIDTYNGWLSLAAYIETTRRLAGEDIKRETVWSNCSVIANAAINKLDAI